MKYLLDTHILLWLQSEPEKIHPKIQTLLLENSTIVFYSMVNLWEIAVKNNLKRQNFNVDIDLLVSACEQNDFIRLDLQLAHVKQYQELPLIHRDPFDRILIAQAISENLCLITDDGIIKDYPNVEILLN